MKKILSIVISAAIAMQMLSAVALAEDVNEFPPQRPAVGNMKVDANLSNSVVVGLRSNGTINVKFPSYTDNAIKDRLLSLTNIVDVATAHQVEDLAALRADGTVYVTGRDISPYNASFTDALSWTDIVAIDCGMYHLVGLKADGTVVATGNNNNAQCDVAGWNNISKIYATDNTTIGIKKDGTVLATGSITNYSDLRKYKNVKDIVQTGYTTFDVLFADGSVSKLEDRTYNATIHKFEQATVDAIFKTFVDEEIKKIYNHYNDYYILTESGNLYSLDSTYGNMSVDKLEENIIYLTTNDFGRGTYYYAIDANGQILSNKSAFTSDDWILTTNITYNGNKITSDVPPYVKDGRTLAPMRAILEALGMTVSWDGATRTATAVKADINISISINSNIATVNGEQKTLDVPAEVTNDRTFVPVRFFAEALNMNVDWDNFTKTVIINSK